MVTRRWGPALLAVVGALAVLSPAASAWSGQAEPAQSLNGTLEVDDEPVEGVRIAVTDAAGQPVGEATTGADGSWQVPLPTPGSYRVTLDAATLPEGVRLRNPDRSTLTPTVRAGRQQRLAFALEGGGGEVREGEEAPAPRRDQGPNFAERFAEAATNGVKFGLIIAMTAIGLSLIFGTTGLINFAHGELVTLGAVVAWFLNTEGLRLQLIGAAAIAVALTGIFGGGLELGLWRPLRARNVGLFQMLVISIGLSLVLRHVLLIFFEGRGKPFRNYTIQESLDIGPVSITPRDLIVMGLSVLTLVAVATMLQRTRMGKAMRAVADDVDLAESSGIDVKRVVLIVWVVGAGLAATGGIFLGTVDTVNWLMGFRLLLLMFAGVVLGGLGTAYGAMVGSLVVGLATEVSTLWFSPELKFVWALAVLVAVLLLQPEGILGRRERVG